MSGQNKIKNQIIFNSGLLLSDINLDLLVS